MYSRTIPISITIKPFMALLIGSSVYSGSRPQTFWNLVRLELSDSDENFPTYKTFSLSASWRSQRPARCRYTQRGQNVDRVTFPLALMWCLCSPHGHVGSPLLTDVWCSGGSAVSVLRASNRNIGSCQGTVRPMVFNLSAVLWMKPFFF